MAALPCLLVSTVPRINGSFSDTLCAEPSGTRNTVGPGSDSGHPEDSGRSPLLPPKMTVGSVAECWEGRLGFIVLSGWGEGLGGGWARQATFYQADQVTSGFWVLKPWPPHLTSFCHLFPCF